MNIEDFEAVVQSEARRVGKSVGMDAEDVAQEMRLELIRNAARVDLAGPAMARTIARRCGVRLRRRNMARPVMVSGPNAEAIMSEIPTEMWRPQEALEREAEEATLDRLSSDIDAARRSHKPISTVRAGLARADWITLLKDRDRRFPRSIIENAVDAMLQPVSTKSATPGRDWRADAFRKGAGARLSDHTRGQMATKLFRDPPLTSKYPTDDEARRSHNRDRLAASFDAETVERILATRDVCTTGSRIREAQYAGIAKEQMRGYEDTPDGTRGSED